MKITQEYEESDIDLEDNKLHSLISISVPLLSLFYGSPEVDINTTDGYDKISKKVVATFLNILEKSNYVIVPRESGIPEAFKF